MGGTLSFVRDVSYTVCMMGATEGLSEMTWMLSHPITLESMFDFNLSFFHPMTQCSLVFVAGVSLGYAQH
ncbi:MAG: hypothetical protein VXY77_03745 [Pseudomonadota bacterium]|nr:hypothetical protein [Pseudomonadota bacterium]